MMLLAQAPQSGAETLPPLTMPDVAYSDIGPMIILVVGFLIGFPVAAYVDRPGVVAEQLVERGAAAPLAVRQDHLADSGDARGVERRRQPQRHVPAVGLRAASDVGAVALDDERELHSRGGRRCSSCRSRAVSAATIVCKRGPMGCVVFDGAIPASIEDGIKGPGFPVEVFVADEQAEVSVDALRWVRLARMVLEEQGVRGDAVEEEIRRHRGLQVRERLAGENRAVAASRGSGALVPRSLLQGTLLQRPYPRPVSIHAGALMPAAQRSLFDSRPPGLEYREEFVSPAEEQALVAYAEALTPIFGWLAPLCLVALILIAAYFVWLALGITVRKSVV